MIYIIFLFAIALAIYFKVHYVFIVIAAVVGISKLWFWLCRRHPLAARCIFGFVRGFFGRR